MWLSTHFGSAGRLVEAGRLPDVDAGLVGVVADDDGHLLDRRPLTGVVSTM